MFEEKSILVARNMYCTRHFYFYGQRNWYLRRFFTFVQTLGQNIAGDKEFQAPFDKTPVLAAFFKREQR